jgi:hypothetical protein
MVSNHLSREISIAAPAIPEGLDQRNNEKEACQQKYDTSCEHQRILVNSACSNEKKGADDKQNPAIQLVSYSFVDTSLSVVIHGGFSCQAKNRFPG